MVLGFFEDGLFLRSLERFLAVVFVLVVFVVGFVQGLDRLVFEATYSFLYVNVVIVEALSSVLGFSLFILFCSLLAVIQIFYQGRSLSTSEGLSVVAVVPTYLDSHALERSVPSLVDLDYDGLKVVPVCEEDDEEGVEKCRDLSERFESVDFEVNDSYPGTKAGAVNCAAEKTDSDVLAVFDADQEVQEGFLRTSVGLIENGYDVVQSRIVPRPDGFLETLCYCETLFMYVIPERLADFLTRYKVAGSRGVAVSRSVFEDMDGYDADFITEDMDFTLRCYEQGRKVKPLLSEACTEEAPHNLRDYWGQRKRWVKGHIEVFLSRLIRFGKYRDVPHLKSAVLSGFMPIGWFFLLFLVSKFLLLILLGLDLFAVIGLANMILISMAFRIYDQRYLGGKRPSIKSLINILGAPLVFPLYGTVAVKSLFEYLFREGSSWYRVDKDS
jgi:cellulose synthase/poly-beta-1,6-N-acetylglucosamine synthase-like glycosyltransferase